MTNISDKINELELADHFDDLVQYANEQASPIEKALLYINILDVFVPALGFEFETAVTGDSKLKRTANKKEVNEKITGNLDKVKYDGGWQEIVDKLGVYTNYRNDFAHNLLIDNKGKHVRDIQEIKRIIFMTGELAEEIYNLIIGAREELEFSSSN